MSKTLQASFTPAAGVCLCVGIVASFLVAARLYLTDETRLRQAFAHTVDGFAAAIDEQIGEDIAILYGLRAFFDASEEVTRAEFHAYAGFLLERYPSMQGVGWVPSVRAEERDAFEERVRRDGFEDFQITERKEQGLMVRAGWREEYFPVFFMEPHEGNEAALGFDLASDPVRREPLAASRDSGEARATSRVTLVQERGEGWAVLIYVPVYRGLPGNLAERRALFQGVVSGVFRIHDLLEAAGTHASHDGIVDLTLLDESTGEEAEVLHRTGLVDTKMAPSFRHERRLEPAGGRQWKLTGVPSLDYVSERRAKAPLASIMVGLVFTAGLTYYVARLSWEKRRVEYEVKLRTAELSERSAALAETNADLQREVTERRALQKQFADVTDHEQRRLGQELHDSLGQQIAVAAMLAGRVHQKLVAAGRPEAEDLARLTESAHTAQAQVRALSKGVLPVQIDRGGLRAALAELAASVKGVSDVEVHFECDEGVVVGNSMAATQLYRIAQEALRNALEHGRVANATIRLGCDEGGLTLSIRDDGKGLGDDDANAAGSGLSIMHHRAELIGATLTIASAPGQGTSVTCLLPCDAPLSRS